MSERRERRKNPYVTAEVCLSRHEGLTKQMESLNNELKTIKRALVGEDLQGGLVKTVSDIQSKLGLLRDWVKPVIIAVASALITAWVMKAFHF